MNYQQLLEQVRSFIVKFFKARDHSDLVYHDLAHTESVAANAAQIGQFYQLNERDFFIVVCAAWFHDTGYLTGGAQDHESRGAEMASSFLKDRQADPEVITAVRDCIMATRMPQNPRNLNEQIICDADLFHLGTADFSTLNRLMRKEAESRLGKKITKDEWRKGTIRFLEAHHYQTDYSHKTLDSRKKQNLKELRSKDQQAGSAVETNLNEKGPASVVLPNDAGNPANPKKAKSDRPERGIETMFRISSANHQRLSDMADNKAHIMITTTSIIISVLLSVLLRKLEDNPHLVIPTMILLTVCVVTMVFSILATRPSLPRGTFTPQDLESRKVNLLFFGNYYRMSFDDYEAGMKLLMNDRDFLYGSLTRDVYSQGIVLGKKYGLLRKAYSIFMYGIVASVISFIIASVIFK